MGKSYFKYCRTAEELKKAYRNAAKILHPDAGGDEDEFKRMQAEFSNAWELLKNIHKNAEGETYTRETTETAGGFMDIIETLLHLEGVQTEICGTWIWCSGNTRPYRDTFRKLGFRWSKTKSAWYYHSGPYRKFNGCELSLDEIREMYGSKQYNKTNMKAISFLPAGKNSL